MDVILGLIFLFFAVYWGFHWLFQKVIIFEYQRGLRYYKGQSKETLLPGLYWAFTPTTKIVAVEMRPRILKVSPQEILSKDNVALKITLVAKIEVEDPHHAINRVENFEEAIYLEFQLALREIVGKTPVDDFLSEKEKISGEIFKMTSTPIEKLGVRLHSVDIKDVILPADFKKILAETVRARKEGLALLERARGEMAALRKLANAAKMLEDNPQLLQLRLVQEMGESKGNSLVINLDGNKTIPLTKS
ncbi:slipin family protein [Candidatus Riflebacteria bacterium]